MRPKTEAREQARTLRAEGHSLAAIARELAVSKSSVSVWVRDVPRPAPSAPPPPLTKLPIAGGSFKRCGKCQRVLPFELFSRGTRQGRQHWCRQCFREYFRDRAELHRQQVRSSRQRRMELARQRAIEVLGASSCADCGDARMVVLEFDHVRGTKVAAICTLINQGASINKLDAEIAKCEVVCVNCHRRRTARRAGWWRVFAGENPGLALPQERWPRSRRARDLVRRTLETSPCADCGETDIVILDFDHLRDKLFTVGEGLSRESSVERIARELSKCTVRCGNCHRIRTAEQGGYFRHHAARAPVAQR